MLGLNGNLKKVFNTEEFKIFENTYLSLRNSDVWREYEEFGYYDTKNLNEHERQVMDAVVEADSWDQSVENLYIYHTMRTYHHCNPAYPTIVFDKKKVVEIVDENKYSATTVSKILEYLDRTHGDNIHMDEDDFDMFGCPDVDDVDAFGNTPLMIVCYGPLPNLPLVKFFLDIGADPNIKNLNGQTCLDIAKEHDMKAIVEYLLNNSFSCIKHEYKFLQQISNEERARRFADFEFNSDTVETMAVLFDLDPLMFKEIVSRTLTQEECNIVIEFMERYGKIESFRFSCIPNKNEITQILVDLFIEALTTGNRIFQRRDWYTIAYELRRFESLSKMLDCTSMGYIFYVLEYTCDPKFVESYLMSKIGNYDMSFICFTTNYFPSIGYEMIIREHRRGWNVGFVLATINFPLDEINRQKYYQMHQKIGHHFEMVSTMLHFFTQNRCRKVETEIVLNYWVFLVCFEMYVQNCSTRARQLANSLAFNTSVKMYPRTIMTNCANYLKRHSSNRSMMFRFIADVFSSQYGGEHQPIVQTKMFIDSDPADTLMILSAVKDGYLDAGNSNVRWWMSTDSLHRFANITKSLNSDILERFANILCDRNPNSPIPTVFRNSAFEKMMNSL